MVVDPHGELARDILSMVPEERHDDVIYVNPGSLYKYGRTVQINPLEVKTDAEKYVVVMAFVGTLYNLYKDSWGPRLETVLRNAANALVETKDKNTLRSMSQMITDESVRMEILDDISSNDVRHFWEEIFQKQYARDAGSSAYNKMDKILATPSVAAMFDATKSSIQISDVIEESRILVVDLSTGTSDDIAEFLGSIWLNMLYVEAKKRIDLSSSDLGMMRKRPFYAYVDEAHMFSNNTMSEMLRSLRKFGVKVTIATQTCNAFDKDFADEIPGTCKTLITGRCDYNTANLIRSIMSVSTEGMQRLASHTFAIHSDERGVSANGVFRTRPVPFDGVRTCDWSELARKSTERWGNAVNVDSYSSRRFGKLLFSPLETAIVHLLHFDQRDWHMEEIWNSVSEVFDSIKEKNVTAAVDKLVRNRYLRIRYPGDDDGDEDLTKRYVAAEKLYSTYLSEAYGGRRAGGGEHREIMSRIMRECRKLHMYCQPDLGNGGTEAPDILIVEPDVIKQKTGAVTYDPRNWNKRTMLAVEVETNPGKHIEHSVHNYTKNVEKGMHVWFVCEKEKHRVKLEEAIRARHPGFERCKMDVINVKKVLRNEMPIPATYLDVFAGIKVKSIGSLIRIAGRTSTTERQSEYTITGMRADDIVPARDCKLDDYVDASDHTPKSDSRDNLNADSDGVARYQAKGATYGHGEIVNAAGNTELGIRTDSQPRNAQLTPLEFKILEYLQYHEEMADNVNQIKKAIQLDDTRSEIREAITSMIKKGAIVSDYRSKTVMTGGLNGKPDQRRTKKIKVLTPKYMNLMSFEKDAPSTDMIQS